jgi:hypothetical protein
MITLITGCLLFKKHKENCQYKADKSNYMVPLDGLSLEHEQYNDRENRQGYDFLDHFQLKQIERPTIGNKANPVGRDSKTVLEKSYSP